MPHFGGTQEQAMFTLAIGLGVISIAVGIGMQVVRSAQQQKQFRRAIDVPIPTLSMAQSVQYPRCARAETAGQPLHPLDHRLAEG
jgi:hypothetical protein